MRPSTSRPRTIRADASARRQATSHGHAVEHMTHPTSRDDRKTSGGCRGAVLTSLIGVAIGFALCLPILAQARLERDNESRAWGYFIAMTIGSGVAFVGGLLGLITGALVGPRAALAIFFTRGLLTGLVAAVSGYAAGSLISRVGGQRGLVTDWGRLSAIYVGLIGIIVGTIVGAWKATTTPSKGNKAGR
jgi:hypothetical protein